MIFAPERRLRCDQRDNAHTRNRQLPRAKLRHSVPSPRRSVTVRPPPVTTTTPRPTNTPNTSLLGPAKSIVPRTAIRQNGERSYGTDVRSYIMLCFMVRAATTVKDVAIHRLVDIAPSLAGLGGGRHSTSSTLTGPMSKGFVIGNAACWPSVSTRPSQNARPLAQPHSPDKVCFPAALTKSASPPDVLTTGPIN
jgi:hypothetical protein